MARIRSIKPEFSHSDSIAAMPRDVRLHFIQLWTYADDYGRGKDDPRVIKGAIWPLDDDVTAELVESWQSALADHGRIVRYTVDDRRFFEIVNWMEHQKPNRRTDSKHPAPDQGIPVQAVQAQCIDSASAVQVQRDCPAVVVGGDVDVEGALAATADPVDWAQSRIGRLPEEAEAVMGSLIDRYGEPFIRETMLTLHGRKFAHASDLRTAVDRIAATRTDLFGLDTASHGTQSRPRPAEFTGFAYEAPNVADVAPLLSEARTRLHSNAEATA